MEQLQRELDVLFASLRHLYWRLRAVRRHDSTARRRLYRVISAERKKFDGLGVDAELIRLFCRHCAQPWNKAGERRYFRRMSFVAEQRHLSS